MLIFNQKGTFPLHIHEVLTLAPFLFYPMSSAINKYTTWLNTIIENKDVLLAIQHISANSWKVRRERTSLKQFKIYSMAILSTGKIACPTFAIIISNSFSFLNLPLRVFHSAHYVHKYLHTALASAIRHFLPFSALAVGRWWWRGVSSPVRPPVWAKPSAHHRHVSTCKNI